MEKNIKNIEYTIKDRQSNFNHKKNFTEISNNMSVNKSGSTTKNIFLSLPKINTQENKIHQSFLKTLNLTIQHKRNKAKDSLKPEFITTYEHSVHTIPNKNTPNLINVKIIEKDKINNLPKNKYTILFDDICYTNLFQQYNETYFNTINKNESKNKELNGTSIKSKVNKSSENNSRTQNIFQKKNSIDYMAPIYKNMKTFKMKEEPNLKKLNLWELMKKNNKYNNNIKSNICLLNDDNKCDNNEQSLKQCFKIGHKFSSEEKTKNVNKRNEFFSKIKSLYEERKENKIKKKFFQFRNCHEVLKHYKNKRFSNCKKLIEQTLLDVKKEKNLINDFFDNYKKVFDAYDDWNDPKNNDNLYND